MIFRIKHSVIIIRLSFIVWSIFGAIFIGIEYIIVGILFSIFCLHKMPVEEISQSKIRSHTTKIFISIFVFVMLLNSFSIFESFKYLFSSSKVEEFIENANSSIGKGRSIQELLLDAITIIPLLLIDTTSHFKKKYKLPLLLLIILFALYKSGSGRGLLSIFLLSIFLPKIKNIWNLTFFGILFLGLYTGISFYRDGISENLFLPILDSFAFPAYNLSLLANKAVTLNAFDYILQIFQKLLPSFFFDKSIFSFNIEMTKIIYPFMGNKVRSISVFTYLGDMITYKPIFIMIAFNIFVLRLIGGYVFKIIIKYNLKSTSLFIALFYVTSLRSRISDLISYLILYLFILISFDLINRLKINCRPVNQL